MGLHEFDPTPIDFDAELPADDDELTCEHGGGWCLFCDSDDEPAPFPCCGGIGTHSNLCG